MGMDQRQRRREGSRRAQASRSRRQDARHRRRNRTFVTYGIGGAVVTAIVVILVILLRGSSPDIGIEVSELAGFHSPPYVYNTNITVDELPARIPPTSGNHFPQQSPYGHLGGPLTPEAVVHNMEHGAAVIWYQPNDPALAGQVNLLVNGLGNDCLVAGTFTDMDFEVAATVWGRVLPLREFDSGQLREFILAFRGNEGPEAGLCRGRS